MWTGRDRSPSSSPKIGMAVRSIHAVWKDGKSAKEARKGRGVAWRAALSRLLGLLCLEILVNSVEFGSACSQYECSTD
jgi:hypothetical protein